MAVESLPTTEQAGQDNTQENIIVLEYSANLIDELSELVKRERRLETIIVDVTEWGLLFTSEILYQSAKLAKRLLELKGTLLFLTTDKAVAIVRESLMGILSFHLFDSHAELFDYSPSLAKHIQACLSHKAVFEGHSTDLVEQVLMSSHPVLTSYGIQLKAGMDSPTKRNHVLAAIDNYTPLSTIINGLCSRNNITQLELMEELKALETSGAIYPIFPKIPFLVNCFRNKTPFSLRDYLFEAKLVSKDQLEEMLLELNSTPSKENVALGPLAVKKGYVNGRQLEIALQDQAFYGQSGDADEVKLIAKSGEETKVQSLVGHLGTTDPSNLLQNLATNRETGVLSVEYKDLQFRAQFEIGRVTHAVVGKITGNDAILEFCSAWRDGIFVFIQRTPSYDLTKDSSKVTKPLDKLLLDAALAKDNMNVVFKKIPQGVDSVLEKLPDEKNLLESEKLIDAREKKVLARREVEVMKHFWDALDGLTPISVIIRQVGDLTTADAAKAIDRLLHYSLVTVPVIDLQGALGKFRELVKSVSEEIGSERSAAFLRLSLRDTIGYSGRASIFVLGVNLEVGVDVANARSASTSLSAVIKGLEDWQVKYIEYVSQELDRDILLAIIKRIHQAE